MSEEEEKNTENKGGNHGTIVAWSIERELRTSYLNYSMSVIVSRALPDVRDGLKPVQRRILTSMRDLNLNASAKTRKCAKVVGDTMGNYHPHGDSAIYDTLVRMGQPFNMRYPLILGQGNFGSISGDPAAAQRYTECRMERLSGDLLADLDKDTVDFADNYDGTLTEPTVLPAKAPMLLLNGATGIAVGMATSIPPHNLTEVCSGLIALLDNPDIDIRGLMEHVKGPDFPTGGYICGREGLYNAFSTGRGSIVMRAKCHIETSKKNGRQTIIVTEIPYQLNLETLEKKIALVVKEDRVQGISALQNFSNKNGIRLAIELKMGEDADVVLNQLYKTTPLQSRFSANCIALVRGRPETLTLKQMLECHRDHRFEVIRRRTLFLLRKAEARAHILEGLLIALDNIDEVIRIIRESADVPTARVSLMERFNLTQVQSQAILDMRLSRLTGLQRQELEKEYAELQKQIADYQAILADAKLVYDIIREDCYELIDKYGDERRSEIIAAVEDITVEDLIAEEEMAVLVSHAGYIKRMALDTYRQQGRGGKGVTGMATKDGDFTEHLFIGSTHDYILFFTTRGQVHWLKVYDVPQMGRAARGRSLANVLQLTGEERVSAMVPVRTFDEEQFLVMATRRGTIKKTALQAFRRPMKGGIRAINLSADDELIGVQITSGEDELMLASRKGQACRFRERDVRAMGRMAAGVRGMRLRDEDCCIGLLKVTGDMAVLTISEKGLGKRSAFADYRLTKRGAKGVANMKITDKTGEVVACMAVSEEDAVMMMTQGGMVVRIPVAGIRIIGRATQGVRVIMLKAKDAVGAVARIVGGEQTTDNDSDTDGDNEGKSENDTTDETASPAADDVASENTENEDA